MFFGFYIMETLVSLIRSQNFPCTPTWGESLLTEEAFPSLVVKGGFDSSILVSPGILNFSANFLLDKSWGVNY